LGERITSLLLSSPPATPDVLSQQREALRSLLHDVRSMCVTDRDSDGCA
jgi:hypothetical protein